MKVCVKEIEIRELHQRTFDLKLAELSDGVNVVYGPNGSGKTVLTNGVSRIFSAREAGRADRIVGMLEVGGKPVAIDLHGRMNEGAEWPQSSRVGLYSLTVADLIQGPEEKDRDRIREALAGGLALRQLEAESPGKKPVGEVKSARQKLEAKQGTALELRRNEEALKVVKEKLRAALRARDDGGLLQKWLEAAGHERRAEALKEELAEVLKGCPGVDRQSEEAPEQLESQGVAYEQARAALRGALKGMERFGGRRAPGAMSAVDGQGLDGLEEERAQIVERQRQAEMSLKLARSAVETAKLELAKSSAGRAPAPLGAEDRQSLEQLAEEVAERRKGRDEAATVEQQAQQALAGARQRYVNAGGDAESHPEVAPAGDLVQQAQGLDEEIVSAAANGASAQRELERAKGQHEEAVRALPSVRVPAREVLEQLQKVPGIAALMDRVREVEAEKKGREAVAEGMEKEAGKAKQEAAEAGAAVETLRDWLRASAEVAAPAGAGLWVAWVAVAFVLVAICVGLVVGWVAGTLAGMAGLAVVAAALVVRGRGRVTGEDRRPRIAQRVPEGWRPAEWTGEAVGEKYAAAARAVEKCAALEGSARDAGLRAREVNAAGVREALEERRRVFTEATGVKLDGGYELAHLVQRLGGLSDAERQLAAAKKAVDGAEARVKELTERRKGLLAKIGAPCATGAKAKEWRDALAQLLVAEMSWRKAQEAVEKRQGEADEAMTRLAGFFERFGWPCKGEPQMAKKGFEEWFSRTEALIGAEQALGKAEAGVREAAVALEENGQRLRALFERYAFKCPANPGEGIVPFREWFDASTRLGEARGRVKQARKTLVRWLIESGVPGRAAGGAQRARLEDRARVPRQRAGIAAKWRELKGEREDCLRDARNARASVDWGEVFGRLGMPVEPEIDAVLAAKELLDRDAREADEYRRQITETETNLKSAERANDLPGMAQAMASAVAKMDGWLSGRLNQLAASAVIDSISAAVRNEATGPVVRRAEEHLKRFTRGRYGKLDAEGEEITVWDGREARRKGIDALSTGTRAHLALAVRLAVIEASETEQYRFPLFLDEVMATSDPEATEAIASAVAEIARQRQVVVLTNQPEDVAKMKAACGEGLAVRMVGEGPVPVITPPTAPPEAAEGEPAREGLPVTVTIEQWPPGLLKEVIPQLGDSARTVHEAALRVAEGDRGRIGAMLEALEAVRERVAKAYRPLRMDELETVEWVGDRFRERVRAVLEDAGGDARKFLDGFREIERMRESNKQACEEWLGANGYLNEPPTMRELVEAGRGKLPAEWAGREAMAAGFAQVFARYAMG